MKIPVLGVEFDALTLEAAVLAAAEMLGTGGSIVTANPEILLRCRADADYARAVNGADLVVADGVGDLWASRILGTPLPERVAGADLVPELLKRLSERGGSVFLYGGKPGVAERAANALCRAYPGVGIAGAENGYIQDEGALFAALRASKPELLLLGLGAPRQELWMEAHRADTNALMIGVGGLLDLFAGDVRRAPASWQRAQLEWLYRLLQEPKRIGRMAKLPSILFLASRERMKNGPPKGPAGGSN